MELTVARTYELGVLGGLSALELILADLRRDLLVLLCGQVLLERRGLASLVDGRANAVRGVLDARGRLARLGDAVLLQTGDSRVATLSVGREVDVGRV